MERAQNSSDQSHRCHKFEWYSFETLWLHFYGRGSNSDRSWRCYNGRPAAPSLRGGRDLAVFRGLCSTRNRTKTINHISTFFKLTNKQDGKGFVPISAIAASSLPRDVEKQLFSRKKLTFDLGKLTFDNRVKYWPRAKNTGHQGWVLVEPNPLIFVAKHSDA